MKFPKKLKKRIKVYTSHHTVLNSTIYFCWTNRWKTHQELIFPAPDPEKIRILSLTYPIMLVVTVVVVKFILPVTRVIWSLATQAGQITEITIAEKGESNIVIVDSKGNKVSQVIPAGLSLMVKQGDTKTDQALNMDPNAVVLVKKNLKSYYKTLYESLVILLSVSLLTQISLVLKKNNLKSSSCRIKFLILTKLRNDQ
jgi:hypothetical protein